MKSIKELKNKHGNLPVAVLGGGPSLPEDLKKIPTESILIGVNHHFHRLINADYVVFMDKLNRPGNLLKKGLDQMSGVVRISHYSEQSDYNIDVDYWDGGFSSTLATWLGCYITTGPVLLCGMDCYQGKEKYFYDIGRPLTHRTYTSSLESNLKAWGKAFGNVDTNRIKAVSGPLIELFGKYENPKRNTMDSRTVV